MTDDPTATAEALTCVAIEPGHEADLEGGTDGSAPVPSTATDDAPSAPIPAPTGRLAELLKLVSRRRGATLDELTHIMRWQPHTTRAALSRLRKLGYNVSRAQLGNRMAYRAERE